MSKTTYVNELGKCVAKTQDGRFRAFADGNLYRVYLVGREMNFDADYNFVGYGKKLTANPMGYFKHLENFDYAVAQCQEELDYLVKAGA